MPFLNISPKDVISEGTRIMHAPATFRDNSPYYLLLQVYLGPLRRMTALPILAEGALTCVSGCEW
jgi:hypothetical protein